MCPQITKEKKNVNDICFYVIQLRHEIGSSTSVNCNPSYRYSLLPLELGGLACWYTQVNAMTASPQESTSSQKFIRLGYGPVNLLLIQDRLLTDRPSVLHAQFRQTQLLRDHDCNWLNCAQKILFWSLAL